MGRTVTNGELGTSLLDKVISEAYREVGEQLAVLVGGQLVRVDIHIFVQGPDVAEVLVRGGRAPVSASHGGGVDDVGAVGGEVGTGVAPMGWRDYMVVLAIHVDIVNKITRMGYVIRGKLRLEGEPCIIEAPVGLGIRTAISDTVDVFEVFCLVSNFVHESRPKLFSLANLMHKERAILGVASSQRHDSGKKSPG
jgi:hypothetical protein